MKTYRSHQSATTALILIACWSGSGVFLLPAMAAVPPPPNVAAIPELAQPVVMEAEAITLQLECRGKAMQGTFHPIQATILEATPWGAGPLAQADQAGYRGQPAAAAKAKAAAQAKAAAKQAAAALTVLVTLKPAGNAVLEIDTPAGKAAVNVEETNFTAAKKYLDGAIEVRRVPAATRLTAGPTDNDYPAAARAKDGTVWAVFVAYQRGGEPDMEAAARGEFSTLVPKGNGDQVRLMKFDGRQWSAPLPVTQPQLDVWKPTVTVAGDGKVWVAWSQQSGGNWDIYRRSYDPVKERWSPVEKITAGSGANVNVVSTTDAKGLPWWAWQRRQGKHFQIALAGGAGSITPIAVTQEPANHWTPAIAADSRGAVYVAWDSYQNGNYDVFMQPFSAGKAEPVVPVATSSAFEARPSLAIDAQDRVWIAYEVGGPNWGKDYGLMVPKSAGYPAPGAKDDYGDGTGRTGSGGDGVGIPLYKVRRIAVKCYAEGRLQRPSADLEAACKGMLRPKSFPRLAVAADGRLWLLFRHHPHPDGMRETWAEYAIPYDGKAWGAPRMLANSDFLLDNRPALTPYGSDGVLAVYSSDWRCAAPIT